MTIIKSDGESFSLERNLPGVSRGTRVTMQKYLELVFRWNEKINLTGVKTPEEFCRHHLLDCINAYKVVKKTSTFLDVGSGCGLPGVVWACLDPQTKFFLLEAHQKKASFLMRVASLLKLQNVEVLPFRLKEIPFTHLKKFSGVPIDCVSRGTAHPTQLLSLAGSTKFNWKNWYVFSSENTFDEFLTMVENSAMKTNALRYPQGLEEEEKKSGILAQIFKA